MGKTAKPRQLTGLYGYAVPIYQGKSWLEPEEWAYPKGGFTRRACVRCPDGEYRVVKCSIADTYFTIPAHLVYKGKHVSGYISTDEKSSEREFVFLPCGMHKDVFATPVVPLGGSPEKVQLLENLNVADELKREIWAELRIPKKVLEAPPEHRTATEVQAQELK
jgi:hypothetical protein